MVAHVSFPAIDARPASLSSWWINHYLRGELEFKGAVISDDLSMVGAAVVGSVETRVRLALEAGCDLVLLCNAPEQVPRRARVVDTATSIRPRSCGSRGCTAAASSSGRVCMPRPSGRRRARLVAPLCARPKLELEG